MCGIAGIINRQLARGEEGHSSMMERLHRMTNVIQHRGPDGEGFWVNLSATAGLGHRRLSIIDLSDSAAQPMHSMNGEVTPRYSIVHNGEIYNYLELKEELQKNGYSFRNQSDTEVILAAYDYWKDECVDQFDGMFAFAIWDEQEKELFAARDRFGEKPFFYAFDEKQLVFASEMKGLWAAGVERKPNQQMLFNFITIGYTGNPDQPAETFFENIHKLPPATTLKYSADRHEIVLEKYWDIEPEEQDNILSDAEVMEKFRQLLTTSVKRRLRSDVPVGTSLSGGLDSSSVVSFMHELQMLPGKLNDLHPVISLPGNSPQAFTAIFPGYEKDESFYSKQAADQFGMKQHTIAVSIDDLLNDWERFCHHQEEPVGSASAYAQYKVFELAKQNGVKVLLDGQGADETLAGYHKYYKWYWQELFHKRKLHSSRELRAARNNGIREKFGLKNIIASLFPDLASVILERQYLLHAIRQEDLDNNFVKSQSKEAYYSTPAHFNLNGVLYFNTCVQGLEELLRYADRNAMAHGREPRLPFLSHELVEFVFTLPAHFKIREGWTKWLLRKTMEPSLPADITWRKEKIGFEPPQAAWMQNKRLQERIHESRKKLVEEKILGATVLDKPIRILSSHAADNYDWRYLAAASTLYD
jgi:asparagine synthase (glutamine-hydrolysing)